MLKISTYNYIPATFNPITILVFPLKNDSVFNRKTIFSKKQKLSWQTF